MVRIFRLSDKLTAELSSGPKGRRAEPHNYRAKIEIEKTMRLSFHGHRGKRHGSRARAPSDDDDDDVAQNGGHTPEKV